MKRKMIRMLEPLTSIFLAFLVGSIVILCIGESPLELRTLFTGAFGSQVNFGQTLMKATTLALTGLSYAFAYRCGLINIGAEGQLYMGALGAAYVAIYVQGIPTIFVVLLAILASIVCGGLFGLLVGVLKTQFGANEVITTVMLNYIAALLVEWAVTGPLQDPNSNAAQTIMFDQSLWLGYIVPNAKIHTGIILVIICLVFYGLFLWKTAPGFGMQIVGLNNRAASYAGINVKKNVLLAMTISGVFAGLAGSIEVLGVQHRLVKDMASNFGFDGIAVALLGGNHPVGIALSSLLMGALKSGGNAIQMFTNIPASVVDLIRALVIVFVLINVFKLIISSRQKGVDKNV